MKPSTGKTGVLKAGSKTDFSFPSDIAQSLDQVATAKSKVDNVVNNVNTVKETESKADSVTKVETRGTMTIITTVPRKKDK